jgi:polyhydroxyalkanoate synthesis regulator phasin
MNSNTFVDLLQTGFRVSLGATTSLVETLQDPQKRAESLRELSSELSQKVADWAEKGAVTEQEARRFLEQVWRQQSRSREASAPTSPSDMPMTTSAPVATSPNVQLEIEELTAQIAAIRAELENLRDTRSDN